MKKYFLIITLLLFSCRKELDISDFSFNYAGYEPELRIEAIILPHDSTAIVRIDNQSTSNAAELLCLDYPQILDGGGSPTSLGASGHPIMVIVASDIIYELRGDGSCGSTQALTFTGGHDTSCKDDDDLVYNYSVSILGVNFTEP